MPDASTSPPRPRRGSAGRHRRTPLSRRSIVTSAIALIERDGPDALSMRRLGGRLGVEAMALYHHFGSRDELITAIADDLLAPLED